MKPDWQEELKRTAASLKAFLDSDAHANLPVITRIIIHNDRESAVRATGMVTEGVITAEQAVWMVGSFARLDWAMANLPPGVLQQMWPALWVGSDPDDTDPKFLEYWRWLKEQDGRYMVTTDQPRADKLVGKINRLGHVPVYRGQEEDAPFGIAWTLDRAMAEKFARGAGQRAPLQRPAVYGLEVTPNDILGLLTSRGEQEVIVDTAGITSKAREAARG